MLERSELALNICLVRIGGGDRSRTDADNAMHCKQLAESRRDRRGDAIERSGEDEIPHSQGTEIFVPFPSLPCCWLLSRCRWPRLQCSSALFLSSSCHFPPSPSSPHPALIDDASRHMVHLLSMTPSGPPAMATSSISSSPFHTSSSHQLSSTQQHLLPTARFFSIEPL